MATGHCHSKQTSRVLGCVVIANRDIAMEQTMASVGIIFRKRDIVFILCQWITLILLMSSQELASAQSFRNQGKAIPD